MQSMNGTGKVVKLCHKVANSLTWAPWHSHYGCPGCLDT